MVLNFLGVSTTGLSLSDSSYTIGGTSPERFLYFSEEDDEVELLSTGLGGLVVELCTEIVLQLALQDAESSLDEGLCCKDTDLDLDKLVTETSPTATTSFLLSLGVTLCDKVAADLHEALHVTETSLEDTLLLTLGSDGTAAVLQGALQVIETSLDDG